MNRRILVVSLAIMSGGVLPNPVAAETGTTNIISGINNNAGATFIIGDTGPFNALIVTNSGSVSNGVGIIGNFSAAVSNTALVTGSGSVWTNVSSLSVGNTGSVNQLTIRSSGQVVASQFIIGQAPGGNNNLVLVTDPSSLLSIGAVNSFLGSSGNNNQLVISNTAQAFFGANLSIGNDNVTGTRGVNNAVTVTGNNSLLGISRTNFIGSFGNGNTLTISSGGRVTNSVGIIGNDAGAKSNQVTVTGSGSVWSNASSLIVGNLGSFNSLTISSSGLVVNTSGSVGDQAGAFSNTVLVTGSGTMWSNSSTLIVGNFGNRNQLTVSSGGQVTAVGLFIGHQGAGASNNTILVTGSGSTYTGLVTPNSILGNGGGGNQLLVSDGGRVDLNSNLRLGNNGANSLNNSVVVSGSGAQLNVSSNILVGASSSSTGNQLIITNGGMVVAATVSNAPSGGSGSVFISSGGTLEANTLVSSVGGSGTISNIGGIYQFTSATPTITASPAGSIVLSNGTISLRNVASANVLGNVTGSGNQLANISYFGDNTFRLNSSTNASGVTSYTFNTGLGATNYVGLELINDASSWRSERLNLGSGGRILVSNSLGSVSATFTNQGVTTVAYSRFNWNSNVVTSGRFISDHSTNTFVRNVAVTNSGTLEGQSREWFTFSQSLFISSANSNQFNLSLSVVEFKGSTGGINHTNAITGRDAGPLIANGGYVNNFAYDTLRMTNITDTLCFQSGTTPVSASNALYVSFLDLGGNTNLVANIHAPSTIHIYYLDSTLDTRNAYLNNLTYPLTDCNGGVGGLLLPAIPEPSALTLLMLASLAVLLRKR